MIFCNKFTRKGDFVGLFRLLRFMQRFFSLFDFRSPWFWLGIGLAAILIRGLFIDVMDIDAAQYASISMEMLQNGSWLQVQHLGIDYLDKPPLLFWLSASSFSVFGISNWAYKLPSLLGAFAGVWAVYRFCQLFYSHKTARQAAFMLASALGLIVICNDVRTDTLLLGTSTCAIWQLAAYLQHGRWRYLLGGFFFIGLSMLAKGPIGLVVAAFGIGTHLLLGGQWRSIFKWQWLAGLLVTAAVLAPMCWGLWQQFDLHPEKVVNGRSGVSGLYFFFWEQSFGRVTGENVWRNDASAFYFLHVYLWAFLPWCLLLPGAIYGRFVETFGRFFTSRKFKSSEPITTFEKSKTSRKVEHISLGAFVLTFIALSMSQYKLPHYIFITLPWAAVLVATALNVAETKTQHLRWPWIGLYIAMTIGLVIALLIPAFVFPTGNIFLWGLLLVALGGLLLRIVKNPFPADADILVQRGVWASIVIGLVVNFYFYPNLLPYQSSKPEAKFARENNIPASKMAYFRRSSHALDFYNRDILEGFSDPGLVQEQADTNGEFWLRADEAGKGELELSGVNFEVLRRFQHFKVAQLRAPFLDPAQRESSLDTIYLLKIRSSLPHSPE